MTDRCGAGVAHSLDYQPGEAKMHTNKTLIEEILDGAEGLDETTRIAFVNKACNGDAALAAEVHSLLSAGDESSLKDFLADGLPQMMNSVAQREANLTGDTDSRTLKREKAEEEKRWVGAYVGEIFKDRGRYQILELRRFGLMAALFFGKDRKLGVDVVIKIPRMSAYVERIDDDDSVRDAKTNIRNNFRREYDALIKLESCGFVVQVRDFDELKDGRPFMVLEYISGKNGLDLLQSSSTKTGVRTGLAFADVANIVRQAGKGLEAAHRLEILHRDIKAENVMIGNDGHVRLIDFNAAAVKIPISPMSTVFRDQTWGTLGYTSPEQLKNMLAEGDDVVELTPASDIYSLTVTAYQLLTGRMPFSRNLADLITEQMDCAFVPASRFRSGLEKDVDPLIRQALDFEPSRRPQSALKFGEQLARALEKLGDQPTSPPVPLPGPRFTGKHVLALLSILIVIAFGAWLISKSINPETKSTVEASTPSLPSPQISETASRSLASNAPRAFSFWLDWTRTQNGTPLAGGPIKASGQEIFTNGDLFVLNFESPQDGYLYLLNEGRNYNDAQTFYYQGTHKVKANQKVPSAELVFDNKDGIEQFWILVSDQPVPFLEAYQPPMEIPEVKGDELRNYLNQHVPADLSSRENMSTATTEVNASGKTVAYRLSLRHRKNQSAQ